MRIFIAIELPQEIKVALGRLQQELKKAGADVKWVETENIHLTLKFLGEVDEEKLENIKQALEEVASGNQQFKIRLASCGAFPKIISPRVIWVGIDQGDKETKMIASGLEEKLAALGFAKEERPFSSHITIARTRSGLNRLKLVQELEKAQSHFGGKNLEFTAGKLTLFKSTLKPTGPVYQALHEANLKTT
jgi:2'-5' RNA ligase